MDLALSLGLGVEFMIHSNRIGAAGYLSSADFTALLDYVVTKRDPGQIEVLTPLAWRSPTQPTHGI
ncbi:hypothetical protein NtRootA9_28890 [Arthrobacter sp. NtRootA9]|nr:hypothetical protein NtRootA9_28890 [Arthrobacter sp. NtRootA9]